MDVIANELLENGIDIDASALFRHINYVLDDHKDLYNTMANRLNSNDLRDVFNEMNVNNFGRVVAYLALVYRMNISEEAAIREAVRLVVPVLKDTNIIRGEQHASWRGDRCYTEIIFWHGMCIVRVEHVVMTTVIARCFEWEFKEGVC